VKRDSNARVAALLRDLAAVQKSPQSRWGYKRAAQAILDLDEPLESLLEPGGTLRKIPHVGPSSLRVIHEFLSTGRSGIVEGAIAESGKASEVERSRELRGNFLSGAQVAEVLRFEANRGVGARHYRGDLQMHSEYSDGRVSIEGLVKGCLARGYHYCAITDHSYGLPIAGGMKMDEMREQHAEINKLNKKFGGEFRVFKGVEANILQDGSLDMDPAELTEFDLVVASPHSSLRKTLDQTERMLNAVSTRGVHILGHPRGRMFNSRAGVLADWTAVFKRAAETGVAIELDGDVSRQDLDFRMATAAKKVGCVFALDSDAHAADQLWMADYAIAHARLAGIPAGRIMNCWPAAEILQWARTFPRPTASKASIR